MAELTMADPIAKGDTLWVVTREGGIHSYTFVEEHENYRGERVLLLAYGKHLKQRNYHKVESCCRSRREACVMAAKTLRYRGELCIAQAKELEDEAAGIPPKAKGYPPVVIKTKEKEGGE